MQLLAASILVVHKFADKVMAAALLHADCTFEGLTRWDAEQHLQRAKCPAESGHWMSPLPCHLTLVLELRDILRKLPRNIRNLGYQCKQHLTDMCFICVCS